MKALWTRLATESKSVPRSSHSLAIVNDKAYIFGGEIVPRIPVDSNLYVYNLKEQAWEEPIAEQTETPSARVGAQMVSIGEKIYVYGGRGGKSMTPLPSEVFEFDTTANTWRLVQVKSGTPPAPRSYHAMTASDSLVYVFGGCPETGRLSDLHSLNPVTGEWKELAQVELSGRGGSCVVYAKDQIFLYGGFNGKELDDFAIYDVKSNTWSIPEQTNSPPSRSVHGTVLVDENKIITLFGEKDPSLIGHEGAGKFHSDAFFANLSPSKVQWTKLDLQGTHPINRGWFQAASWNGKVVLSGGFNEQNERLSDLYVLELQV